MEMRAEVTPWGRAGLQPRRTVRDEGGLYPSSHPEAGHYSGLASAAKAGRATEACGGVKTPPFPLGCDMARTFVTKH
jgi:hypothetical protein